MTQKMITQDRLKELLNYDANTGGFTWLVSNSNRINIGDVAGTNVHGYIRINVDKKIYSAHRLAFLYMNGKFPHKHTDHINHIRNDNRWENIREVSNSENHRNMSFRLDNKSGFTGINWSKERDKWHAQIQINGIMINLGRFKEKWEAICARKSAEFKYGFHVNHGVA